MAKIIVIGAVAGGATVASQIRRLDPDSDITVYEKDRDMSFANCGLPYYLGEVVEDRDMMLSATPEQFKDKKHITRRGKHDDKSRFGESKKGVAYYVYYDLDAHGYRTASQSWKVRY